VAGGSTLSLLCQINDTAAPPPGVVSAQQGLLWPVPATIPNPLWRAGMPLDPVRLTCPDAAVGSKNLLVNKS